MRDEFLDVWRRIDSFELDDKDAEYPFAARLARENHWTSDYTRRVVQEYKCYAALSILTDEAIVPPVDVDTVWHLHLLYSDSYAHFCEAALGRPLLHRPTRGGAAERVKFANLYARTLDVYRSIFECEPPADIWPCVAQRFSSRDYVRVDPHRHWIIAKPSVIMKLVASVLPARRAFATLAIILLSGISCSTDNVSQHDDGCSGPILGVVIILTLSAAQMIFGSGRGGPPPPSTCACL